MSLGGLALGVGMLVDNGIVCLENVHRLRAAGLWSSSCGRRRESCRDRASDLSPWIWAVASGWRGG